MLRRSPQVCGLEIGVLEEVAAHFRCEEDYRTEYHQEHEDRDEVLAGVIGMKCHAIERHPVRTLTLLDLDAVRIVRADLVQRDDVDEYETNQGKRQRNHVQCEEAVQGDVGNRVVTADELDDAVTDDRYGAEQGNDYLCAPVRHLPPRQQVAGEGFGHQDEEDQHTDQPDQLARLLV